jgi:drug/metabolite transporter (DMT)-like permease
MINNNLKVFRTKAYIMLHVLLIFYSFGAVMGKFAMREPTFSIKSICLYALIYLNLFIYAIVWQQVLKVLPLSEAFANKSVSIIWAMLWGSILFGEHIRWNHVLGGIVIFIGICIVVNQNE